MYRSPPPRLRYGAVPMTQAPGLHVPKSAPRSQVPQSLGLQLHRPDARVAAMAIQNGYPILHIRVWPGSRDFVIHRGNIYKGKNPQLVPLGPPGNQHYYYILSEYPEGLRVIAPPGWSAKRVKGFPEVLEIFGPQRVPDDSSPERILPQWIGDRAKEEAPERRSDAS